MEMLNIEKFFVTGFLRDYHYNKGAGKLVLADLNIPQNGKCLEIGCGNGRGALFIKKYVDLKKIVCIDIDPVMIEKANSLMKNRPKWAKSINVENIEFKCADARNLDYPDNYFDAVFQFAVFHHIFDWKKVIIEIYRVLKKGGILSFEDVVLGNFLQIFQKQLYPLYRVVNSVPITKEELLNALKGAGFIIQSCIRKRTLNSLSMYYIKVKK